MTAAANVDAGWTELVTLLGEELGTVRDLISVGTEKRDALVAIDLPRVEATNRREEELVRALGEASLRRAGKIKAIARLHRVTDPEPRLEAIVGFAGEPRASQVAVLRADLRRGLEDLRRLNGLNQALTRQSLTHAQEFLRLLARGGGSASTYTRRGVDDRPVRASLVIDRTA